MQSYKINLQAEQDLADIYRYGVQTYGLSHADTFFDAVFDCFDLIAKSPQTWPHVPHIRKGYRRYIFRKGSARLSVYYRISQGDIVEIMAVIGRQDIERSPL